MTELNWDERYSSKEYIYGVEPNSFLIEHAMMLDGPVLSLAEGEGRNAVYLAKRGLEVHAVDGSAVGLEKANALARTKGVNIYTQVADLGSFTPKPCTYQSVISISAHLPCGIRNRLYPLLVESLKPNGILLLEAYSEHQLNHATGGPKDLDLLMTVEKIQQEFPSLQPIWLKEVERKVCEGIYHTGLASVVQFIGRKPS